MQGELFSLQAFHDAAQQRKDELKAEIQSYEMSAILDEPVDELQRLLENKYRIEVPRLRTDEVHLLEIPKETNVISRHRSFGDDYIEVPSAHVSFTVCIPFEGDGSILHLRPSNFSFTYGRSGNVSIVGQEVHLSYRTEATRNANTDAIYQPDIDLIQTNLQNLSKDVEAFNASLPGLIRVQLHDRRERAEASRSVIQSFKIPIKRRSDTPATYVIPEVRRKPIILEKAKTATIRPEPTLAAEEYENILVIIKDMSLAMERSPKTFTSLSEEEIRNFFLILLNGHYQGNATGETFNGNGKTDIIIRHQNANAFIAECKFWRGPKGLAETIDQLLGYVTWRDTKTSILLFSRSVGLSSVIPRAHEAIRQHKDFKSVHKLTSPTLAANETILSYKFKHPSDSEKEVYLTLLAFQITTPQQ